MTITFSILYLVVFIIAIIGKIKTNDNTEFFAVIGAGWITLTMFFVVIHYIIKYW